MAAWRLTNGPAFPASRRRMRKQCEIISAIHLRRTVAIAQWWTAISGYAERQRNPADDPSVFGPHLASRPGGPASFSTGLSSGTLFDVNLYALTERQYLAADERRATSSASATAMILGANEERVFLNLCERLKQRHRQTDDQCCDNGGRGTQNDGKNAGPQQFQCIPLRSSADDGSTIRAKCYRPAMWRSDQASTVTDAITPRLCPSVVDIARPINDPASETAEFFNI